MNTGIFAIALASIHLFAGKLRCFQKTPHSRWFSFGSGVSVAYVFIHILPELSQAQVTLQNGVNIGVSFLEHHVYLVALLGLTIFYGLERLAKTSRQRQQKIGNADVSYLYVFWLHIASFAIYNLLIGYLVVHREEPGVKSLLLFSFAMALHFIVNDNGLRKNYKKTYDKIGRLLLAIAVMIGWLIGIFTEINQAFIAVLFAFLAGGIVLNVLKEELPEERESCFWSFAFGTISYAILLLAI
ncbi:hypothetical protein PN456_04110 [Nodularia spumigena CS-586/05]|uniref:ZIP Zinc transporter n=1 Tax=Nodularia spumigena CENA596 TaxID=1819295 RepID=A0A161VSD5_NODSP|nr:hypothetical protein [Nodularia spumigena]KZL50105.1 hypothetical protein A2T98_09130 [Nodularia spumigena CENA596]MDB9344669.1 hypothetical protein [Nodularia spumigena CS-588/06]MDB9368145.1 hypothetical protein [Nodularia spumigena CS-586/05]